MRFQGVLHPHAPRRFRLRFPAPRGRVRKCRRGSCSGIRRSEKTPSSSVRHAGQIESGRSFKSVSYRRTWSLQSQELHEMDDACPSLLRSSSVAGHTNTSVVSPGGRLSSRQGAEISANAGSGHGLGSRPPTCIPRWRRSSPRRAGRRGRPSDGLVGTRRSGPRRAARR